MFVDKLLVSTHWLVWFLQHLGFELLRIDFLNFIDILTDSLKVLTRKNQ